MEKPPVRRPSIGILVDRRKLKALRESMMLERIELAELTREAALRQLAAEHGIDGTPAAEDGDIIAVLRSRGAHIPRHIGISRDCIAKIENGDRLRPKISTLRILIEAFNTELTRRGQDPIRIEDLYAEQVTPADEQGKEVPDQPGG